MKLLFSLTSLLILTFSSRGNSEWLYYKHYPWVWDNMTQDWLYLRGSSDGKIYSYRNSTQEWEEFSVSTSSSTSVAVSDNEESFDPNNPSSSLTVDLNSSVSLDMIWVEPGTFWMGQRDIDDAWPIKVTLTQGFYLGKYEVTQAQYEAVMTGNTDGLNAKPSNWPNNPNRPVEKVSHDDIQKFLTRLNSQQSGNIPEGWAYVLPTEAQWEYACRAGTTNTAYSWGDDINSSRANYNWDGYWNTGTDFNQPRDVGMYDANPWGFFDMHGNVWEWCSNGYHDYGRIAVSGSVTDPIGPDTNYPVVRGGCWGNDGPYLRSAQRGYSPSDLRVDNKGFRVGFQKSQ